MMLKSKHIKNHKYFSISISNMEICKECGLELVFYRRDSPTPSLDLVCLCSHSDSKPLVPSEIMTLPDNVKPASMRDRLEQYVAGGVYDSTRDVRNRLGLGWWGIHPIPEENVIVLFANNHNRPSYYKNCYNDLLDLYVYMGEGKYGVQELTKGNKALVDAMNADTQIHLFWSDHMNFHRYVGRVKLLDHRKLEFRQGNQTRLVYVFILKATNETLEKPLVESLPKLDQQSIQKTREMESKTSAPVAVWIAVATLHREQGLDEIFSHDDILDKIVEQNLCQSSKNILLEHITQRCVAGKPLHYEMYRMLYNTGSGKYRLYKKGDYYDPIREGARIAPDPQEIPPQYHNLIEWYCYEWRKFHVTKF